jgi:hypothetical protein
LRYLILLSLSLLSSCSSVPIERFSNMTPAECRTYGVDVPQGAQVTGTIISSNMVTLMTTGRICGNSAAGCAVAEGWEAPFLFPSPTHRYDIYYTETRCDAPHEACHAMYEAWSHTKEACR